MAARSLHIDMDSWIYRFGFAAESGDEIEPLEEIVESFRLGMDALMYDTNAETTSVWLGGQGNYRNNIATIQEYKGNRTGKRPEYYDYLRDFAQHEYGAKFTENEEADDRVSIEHLEEHWDFVHGKQELEPCIVTQDKDLLNTRGLHYNWVTREYKNVSQLEALHNFYTQLLSGDSGDNIPGLFKITGKKAGAKLKDELYALYTAEDMYSYIMSIYKDNYTDEHAAKYNKTAEEVVLEIGQLLHIRQVEGEIWLPPIKPSE